MRRLLLPCLVLFPLAASAQQGSILFDRAVQFDYDLLPEGREALRDRIPPQSFTSMVLFFNESESLMTGAPNAENEAPLELNTDLQGFVTRLKMGSASRSDHETLVEAYVNYENGTVAETREFMGRDFLITGEQPAYAWRLTGEQSEFLGFMVQRAMAEQDSTTIEAWFTPEIPVSAGPGGYGGLPGMILVVSVNDEQLVYSATEVNLDVLKDGVIRKPEDGNKVSRDEYEEIVAEKLEEVRTVGRRLGGDAPSDRRRDAPGDVLR